MWKHLTKMMRQGNNHMTQLMENKNQ